jgi:hypothetical protein
MKKEYTPGILPLDDNRMFFEILRFGDFGVTERDLHPHFQKFTKGVGFFIENDNPW